MKKSDRTMKIFVIGGGAREHALVWKIWQSWQVKEIICAPGNAGIAQLARTVPIKADDLQSLLAFALKEKPYLTVVGPEVPLCLGIVDLFEKHGLLIFGPNKLAAEIEGSKVFAKNLMKENNIPTADFRVFDNPANAKAYVLEYATRRNYPLVVKADGLAAGKGVFVCKTIEEAVQSIDKIMVKKTLGEAGNKIIIEDFLQGEEATFTIFTDGETILPLASSQDHKPVYDGDQGPNTGGMGAYSPAPVVTEEVEAEILSLIVRPILKAMAKEGRLYKGALYIGVIIDRWGRPRVLEFNCRLGDPETQPILMRMQGDIIPILMSCCLTGALRGRRISWDKRTAVCVVMVSEGYPGSYKKGKVISGLTELNNIKFRRIFVFHAGTAINEQGQLVTYGGRVLGVTGMGVSVKTAIKITYEMGVKKIHWDGVHYRTDIGQKALK